GQGRVCGFLKGKTNGGGIGGVFSSGNRNLGDAWGCAGDVIAKKCGVPWMYRFELMGKQRDIDNVRKGVNEFWQQLPRSA
ncbi:class Ib ribonucleoside-diphosphate reductase assembly flavoprotein NrdI, partial [Salmonella enterica]|uniref:class Ib ribonucleoside-diphosphate reductase assembly flavoprotein NrdI n=1 Tax=Salmonella enterica TaxID=28901 RepID=UPI00398C6A37